MCLIKYLFSLSWFLTDFYVVKEVEGTFNKDEVSICRAISTDVKIKELKCLLRLIFGSAPIILSLVQANVWLTYPNVSLLFHQP